MRQGQGDEEEDEEEEDSFYSSPAPISTQFRGSSLCFLPQFHTRPRETYTDAKQASESPAHRGQRGGQGRGDRWRKGGAKDGG